MKITNFKAENVHGYLNFDIDFNDRLTFLTGINGTGKTTALNSIVALLIPDIQFLCNVQYQTIQVSVEVDGKKRTIKAESNDIGAKLSIAGTKGSVQLNSYFRDPDVPTYRQNEYEAEYYREQISDLRGNEVVRQIIDLPSPMYLGLDRRIVHGTGRSIGRPPPRPGARIEGKRTVFSGSMENRLAEAVELAQRSNSQQSIKQNRLDAELQRQLLLELINISPISFSGPLKMPTRKETDQVGGWLETLATLPTILKLPADEVNLAIKPMSEFLVGIRDEIAKLPKGKKAIKGDPEDDDVHEVMIRWAFNASYLEKIQRVSDIILDYDRKKGRIEALNNRYLHGLNKFFSDGGKIVDFDTRGKITFASTRTEEDLGFNSLSSGEIQLFVILTHLYFNPDAQKANLFIIDEPELSLHVNWQEAFVDGLLDATDDVQLILATHAPSVILHRVDACFEIEQS